MPARLAPGGHRNRLAEAKEELIHTNETGTRAKPRITRLRAPPGLRIEGDLDYGALPALTHALDSLPGDSDVVVDLAGVTFIDVGCLRALVNAAERLGLRVHSAPPPVRRLLHLTGWRVQRTISTEHWT
ncbi:STAS domain-containing protein [Nonomuraea sp. NPDC050556]|uniref:STAS domain-containing protein n=1 Tax=Nonomuraea sp. NPDC050556 TaxID=3364369 RepID=UPI0037B5171C